MHRVLKTPHKFGAYIGANRSGRSTALLQRVKLTQGSYVGPRVSSFFSGVAPTVEEEIRLHCGGREELWKKRQELCALFDLTKELGKNPFQKQLSGGQETLVA